MASSSSQPHPITLHFQNHVRVAGETIKSRVDLNVPLALKDGIEHLRIEMRGVIKTQIYQQYGQTGVMHKQTVPLFTENQDLWTGSASAQDVLSFPFRFTLPDNLPPSFCCGKYSPPDATIRYSLEAIGERAGKFHRTAGQGWTGRWNVTEKHEKLRTGIWGDYSHVHATLSLPELASFPVATPIPYTLHIVTETKPLDRSDRPEDKHGRPLFPAPPTDSSELTQEIRRKTEYTGRSLAAAAENARVQAGTTTHEASTEAVQAVVDEPAWVPQDKGRGVWRRSVRFNSTLTFPFAPTWSTETAEWAVSALVGGLLTGGAGSTKPSRSKTDYGIDIDPLLTASTHFTKLVAASAGMAMAAQGQVLVVANEELKSAWGINAVTFRDAAISTFVSYLLPARWLLLDLRELTPSLDE
ncbi:hypothetical protein C8R47DRAFT_1229712 [Mycena vitilis]|nr:hypothetical protein C8R47DRAFT_1229712 [Mycena vitilis]